MKALMGRGMVLAMVSMLAIASTGCAVRTYGPPVYEAEDAAGVEVSPGIVLVEPPMLYGAGGALLVVGSPLYFARYHVVYGHHFHDRWHNYHGGWRGRGPGHHGYIPPRHPGHPHYGRPPAQAPRPGGSMRPPRGQNTPQPAITPRPGGGVHPQAPARPAPKPAPAPVQKKTPKQDQDKRQ